MKITLQEMIKWRDAMAPLANAARIVVHDYTHVDSGRELPSAETVNLFVAHSRLSALIKYASATVAVEVEDAA